MKTVVYFTDSHAYGGAERATITLLAGLDRSRWSPVLAHHGFPGIEPMVDAARELGVPGWRVPEMPYGLRGARRVTGFARALRARGADVFHAQLSWPLSAKYGLAAAVLARVPAVVATVHSYPVFAMDRSTALQQRLLGRRLGRYVAVSDELAAQLHQRLRWPAERIDVVHNGVDFGGLRRERDPRLRATLTGGREQPVIVTPARLDPDKGLDVLIEAAAQVPDVRFAVAGDGPERDALTRRIAELGLEDRVLLLGWRDDVASLLAASDLFVLPSRNEALSISVLEAMSAGCPVVATDVGGTSEAILDGETGLLVHPGDAGALARAISGLLADAEKRRALAASARDRAEREFSAAAMVSRTTAIYDELLGTSAAGHADDELSRLLRRVDWRFLLPIDPPRRIRCFADGFLSLAVERVMGAVVADDDPGACDLVVVSGAGRRRLDEAHAALTPGGAVYAEWPHGLPGGAAAARRRLERAGFTDVRVHWSWPAPGRARSPRFWFPFGSPGARRHFLSTRQTPPGAFGSLRRACLELVWRTADRAGLLAPLCAVGRRPDGTVPGGLPAAIQAGAGPAIHGPADLMLLTVGESSLNKVVALVFAGDEPAPRCAVKVPRTPRAYEGLDREAQHLRAIEARTGAEIRGIPTVLFSERWGEQPVVAESVLSGESVAAMLQAGAPIEPIADQVTDFLIELAGRPETAARASWWPMYVEPALEVVGSMVPGSSDVLPEARDLIATLGDLPVVIEHRDLTPWNLFLDDDGGLVVLDWEVSRLDGLPALDLLHFLTHAVLFRDGTMGSPHEPRSYRELMDERTAAGQVRLACERRYAEALGLPADALHPLRALTWLLQAHSDLSLTSRRKDVFVELLRQELQG